MKWGKAQSAKEDNVPFHYKNFLGYRRGANGKPEIVPEEAVIIKFIYEQFIGGDSFGKIIARLEKEGFKSPTGKDRWTYSTIQSILTNERYKGDAILNKTYIEDCISKKVKINNGERPKYYEVAFRYTKSIYFASVQICPPKTQKYLFCRFFK